jgi:Ca-activated chloride channel family protein
MRFANPEWFGLLWFIPVFWLLIWWSRRTSRERLLRALGVRMTPLLARDLSSAKRNWKMLFRSLAFLCAVIALARPQMGKGLSEIKVRGVELVVLLDVSTSMLAEDVKPSRLQFAKSELVRLFDRMSGDKVGLVGFAGSAVLLSPLTNDISSLKMFLDSLSPYSVETQGTNFTRALAEAAEAFERGGTEDDDRAKTTRVILVLSDGEDQEKGALELAKKLASQGIRIFTLAFGSERGGLIPMRDERGFLRGYKKDRDGKEVVSQVKGGFLRDLARVGQGAFHFATFGGNEVSLLKEDLDKLQQTEFASSLATQYEERFQIFLALAILFLALELVLNERSREARVWRGRFELGLKVILPFAIFFCTEYACAGYAIAGEFAGEFDGVLMNNQAVSNFKKELPVEALDGFSKSLANLPDRAEVHFNIATSFMALKEDEKALREYEVALRASSDLSNTANAELTYKIYFNRAQIFASQKKTAEALRSYQEALRIRPDSREVKTNIELLMMSGDGEGEGESGDQNKDQNNDQNKDSKQNQNQSQDKPKQEKPQSGPTPKPTPKPFKSEQLSQQDVSRILEELKRQEDQIRERMQREGGRDAPLEKDW